MTEKQTPDPYYQLAEDLRLFGQRLLASQRDLSPDAAMVLRSNLWELYDSTAQTPEERRHEAETSEEITGTDRSGRDQRGPESAGVGSSVADGPVSQETPDEAQTAEVTSLAQAIRALLDYGDEEKTAAIKRKDRDNHQFWAGYTYR